MRIPSATYRIQLNLNFRFTDAEKLIPYLHELGISHLYLSPRYQARRGSLHGYDVVDPQRLNPELGTEEEFERMLRQLQTRNMGLLLDIVPNHMAVSSENFWWMDVLENGKASRYSSFFDIDWDAPGSKCPELQKDRVVVPFLPALYESVLVDQGITLQLDEMGLYIEAQGTRLPINPRTYALILDPCLESLKASKLADSSAVQKVEQLSVAFNREDVGFVDRLKQQLWQLCQSDASVGRAISDTLSRFNGTKGNAKSFGELNSLLGRQAYRLAYWRNATAEINYRRFFGLNDLISLRVEDPAVFQARHAPTLQLVAADKIDGLRVDHVDGLRDPLEYLQRLQEIRRADSTNGKGLDFYAIVEKITSGSETIPQDWPIAGTTGYDFLNAVNTLFIDAPGSRELELLYREFTGIHASFAETWYVRKKQVMEELFASDIRMLSSRLGRLAVLDRLGCDIPMRELVRGLKEITACLPIYRTYCRELLLPARDRSYLERAFKIARDRSPAGVVSDSAFDFLRRVFLLDPSLDLKNCPEPWLDFLLRWQQFTGAVMAKGLEDTAFFVHHGLISLNEVGCNPLRKEIRFGVTAFHHHNQSTFRSYPHTLNATSTHDTKWSEDVRARINVLSELPTEWKARLWHWAEMNESKKTTVDGRGVPSPNEEVLLYQSLLGVWPLEETDDASRADLTKRIETFIRKAAREGKTHSSWVSPNEAHEAALGQFISRILDSSADNVFLSDFFNFLGKIAPYGACNGYAQVLLKMTSPGVPDFFQGNELWNFRLTDPDNREPVNFHERSGILDELKHSRADTPPRDPADLLNHWQDGSLKLYLTRTVLNFRRAHAELFSRGDYIPLETTGIHRESVCCFARRLENTWAVVAVPRLVTNLAHAGAFPIGRETWDSTLVVLPWHSPQDWKNLFTGEIVPNVRAKRRRTILLGDAFQRLPFAMLVSGADI
jgi:(1->4)-alpha-D-glucan 1-alpha-D-glucosylmutase